MMLYQKLIMRVISYIIFCCMLFFPVLVLLESTAALSDDEKEIKELQKEIKQEIEKLKKVRAQGKVAIGRFIEDKIIMKIVQPAQLPHAWVDKNFYLISYDNKSKIMRMVYLYYAVDKNGVLKKNGILVIKDGYTGKRIGTYDERGLILK